VLRGSGLPQPGFAAELKAKGDYVTDMDRRSESAILEVLAREAPGIAVLAEERGGVRAQTMWAVDPLDGTTNFMRGFPSVGPSASRWHYSTAVSLWSAWCSLHTSRSSSPHRGVTELS